MLGLGCRAVTRQPGVGVLWVSSLVSSLANHPTLSQLVGEFFKAVGDLEEPGYRLGAR